VSLTLNNEIVACQDARNAVEYQGQAFFLASAESARLFVEDPASFLQVPLPAVAALLSALERRGEVSIELEGYCPVALVDRKAMIRSSGNHVVAFESKHYSCESKEATRKFMRRPARYAQKAKLPSKKPAVRGEKTAALLSAIELGKQEGRGLEPAEMLTYMQASVAEVICQSLVDSGDKRPLYPGKGPQESALLFLARFLRAKNPVTTQMEAGKVREDFEDFLSTCNLPQTMGEVVTLRAAREAEGTWTTSDAVNFKDLCTRFDSAFSMGF